VYIYGLKSLCCHSIKDLTNHFVAAADLKVEPVTGRVPGRVLDPVSEGRRPVDDLLELARVFGGQRRQARQPGVNQTVGRVSVVR
jgi:hypothetical protein